MTKGRRQTKIMYLNKELEQLFENTLNGAAHNKEVSNNDI